MQIRIRRSGRYGSVVTEPQQAYPDQAFMFRRSRHATREVLRASRAEQCASENGDREAILCASAQDFTSSQLRSSAHRPPLYGVEMVPRFERNAGDDARTWSSRGSSQFAASPSPAPQRRALAQAAASASPPQAAITTVLRAPPSAACSSRGTASPARGCDTSAGEAERQSSGAGTFMTFRRPTAREGGGSAPVPRGMASARDLRPLGESALRERLLRVPCLSLLLRAAPSATGAVTSARLLSNPGPRSRRLRVQQCEVLSRWRSVMNGLPRHEPEGRGNPQPARLRGPLVRGGVRFPMHKELLASRCESARAGRLKCPSSPLGRA
jgi:hypothetical protein